MGVHLAAGLVDGVERRPGQFELAARLQRDGAKADRIGQADDAAVIVDRMPAEQAFHRLEQPADAARALVGHRRMVVEVEAEFLVLGADAPLVLRLRARFERLHQLVAGFDRRRVRDVACHSTGFRKGLERERTRQIRAVRAWRKPAQCGAGGAFRQSPSAAWTRASAATAAVSARRIRGPSGSAVTNGRERRIWRSSAEKPPSGPISTASGDGASADRIDRGSAPASPSSQKTIRRPVLARLPGIEQMR